MNKTKNKEVNKMKIQIRKRTLTEDKTELVEEYFVKDIEMIDSDTIAYIV